MNLIEKLGLEKCKAIVDKSIGGNDETHYCTHVEDYISSIYDGTCPHCILIDDICTAIANHTDNLSHFDHEKCHHEWNETTSNGDAYRFFVCKNCDSTKNYVPFEADHCTDIRNHISPLTGVTER